MVSHGHKFRPTSCHEKDEQLAFSPPWRRSNSPGPGRFSSELAMALWMWNGKRISRMVPLQWSFPVWGLVDLGNSWNLWNLSSHGESFKIYPRTQARFRSGFRRDEHWRHCCWKTRKQACGVNHSCIKSILLFETGIDVSSHFVEPPALVPAWHSVCPPAVFSAEWPIGISLEATKNGFVWQ